MSSPTNPLTQIERDIALLCNAVIVLAALLLVTLPLAVFELLSGN